MAPRAMSRPETSPTRSDGEPLSIDKVGSPCPCFKASC